MIYSIFKSLRPSMCWVSGVHANDWHQEADFEATVVQTDSCTLIRMLALCGSLRVQTHV